MLTHLRIDNPREKDLPTWLTLKGKRAGQFALSLAGGHRLVFEPNQNPIPYQKDGSLDWSKVSKIRMVLIGDYDD